MELHGRMSVRSPMQWMSKDHGGFSTAAPEDLVRPMVSTGAFGYEEVSVGRMRADPGSLLNWMAGLIRTRRECSEIGTGAWSIMQTGNDAVLALRHDIADSSTVILNNLGRKRCTISLDLSGDEISSITDLFCDRAYEPLDSEHPQVRMEGFGYRWMRIGGIY